MSSAESAAVPSLAKSTRRTVEDLLVGGCGLVTSLLTGFVLWVVEQKTGFAFYTWTYWFVIPVGAGLAGFAAASGYYAGARFFGHKPSGIFMANVILCSLATFFFIHYLTYVTLAVDGKQVSDYIPFTQYLDIAIRSASVDFRLRGAKLGGTGELGDAGYLYALFQIAGFAVGGFAVYAYLTQLPYCETCARYLSRKGEQTRYTGDAEGLQAVVATILEHISTGQHADAIEAQRTFGNASDSKNTHLRTEIKVRHCLNCQRHWMKFGVAKKSGNDWKDIPDLTVAGFTDQIIGTDGVRPAPAAQTIAHP